MATADWRGQRDIGLVLLEREKRPEARTAAVSELFDLAAEDDGRWPEFVPLIPQLIADRQAEVRRVGLSIAALVLPPEEAEGILCARLADPAEQVRMEAAGQLADLARPSSRGALAVVLADPVFTVRFEAARGMAALHHRAGLDVLIEALEYRDLRFRALGVLAQLGEAAALPAVRRVFHKFFVPYFDRTQAAGAMARLGDNEGAAYLLDRSRKGSAIDRPLAIELCGEVKAPGARERLLEILSDPRDLYRGAAARGLGRLGDPSALGPLIAALDDRSTPDDVRLDVAEGLCRLNLTEGREAVSRSIPTFVSAESRLELQGMLEEAS